MEFEFLAAPCFGGGSVAVTADLKLERCRIPGSGIVCLNGTPSTALASLNWKHLRAETVLGVPNYTTTKFLVSLRSPRLCVKISR
jgi:hypothetical protein